MKRIVLSSMLALLLVFALCTTSVYALTIDKDWTFSEDFEGRNGVTYNCNTYGGVAFARKTDEATGYGTGGGFIEARYDTTCKIERPEGRNHTPDVDTEAGEGRALRIRNIGTGDNATVYLANTYFYGNPSAQPSGSGVFGVGYDGATEKTYFYNNAKYYEQEFFMLFPAAAEEGQPDGFGNNNISFQWNVKTYNPDNPEKDNDNYKVMMQIVDKKLFGSNTTYIKDMAADTWYDVKFAVDFEKNKAYTYVDGELIFTYEPATQIKSVRRFLITIPRYCTMYLDDLTMNPFGGEGAPAKPYETTYFIGGEEATDMADGILTAKVDITQAGGETVHIISALFDENGNLKNIVIENSDNIAEGEFEANLGMASATDTAKTMIWGGGDLMSPVKEVQSLG